jgi:uncharacterized protein YdhG (YjbR/CyaY superfamily)
MIHNDKEIANKIQTEFESLLKSKFPSLKPMEKWKQTMWHLNGNTIVSLVFLKNKIKFCFFNSDNLDINIVQRWSASIFSLNMEYNYEETINWEKIHELIEQTIITNHK